MRIAQLISHGSILLGLAAVAVASAQAPVVDRELEQIIRQGGGDRDRAFAAQPVDPEWAPVLESALESALENVLEKSDIDIVEKHVECRTSMCRAEIKYPFERPPPEFQDMLMELGAQIASIVEKHRIRGAATSSRLGQSAGEGVTTTIYLGE